MLAGGNLFFYCRFPGGTQNPERSDSRIAAAGPCPEGTAQVVLWVRSFLQKKMLSGITYLQRVA
jgi:hypothetical protein